MYDKLTENDIKKMQEEIDYRKLVVRPKELEAVKEARPQRKLRIQSRQTRQKPQRKPHPLPGKNDQNRPRYFRYLKGR